MTKFSKNYEDFIHRAIRKTFSFWEKLGIHVSPNHYYHPLPDTRELTDDVLNKRSDMAGIRMNEKFQIDLLDTFSSEFKGEYDLFPMSKTSVPWQYYVGNKGFESVDGEILYSMIRHFKPKRIIEIGSGKSTLLSAQAIQVNKQKDPSYDCSLTAIEPYPNELLQKGFPGLSSLIKEKVENVPLDVFKKLEENDILFIDSSHTVKIGGDVLYEILDILPNLNKGVVVHIHDIFLPYQYPKRWTMVDHKFFQEQYLLQAFLEFNDSFEVLWAGNFMHREHPDKLTKAFNSYSKKQWNPASFWIRA